MSVCKDSLTAQKGAHTVEFALTAFAFFVILLGIVEFCRAMWTWGMLSEATRRGARIAAVCNINDRKIYDITKAYPDGLTDENVVVEYEYLDSTGNWSPPVRGPSATPSDVANIRNSQEVYVRVRIENYRPVFAFLFPWTELDEAGNTVLTAPPFETTLPAESLGWDPEATDPWGRKGYWSNCP